MNSLPPIEGLPEPVPVPIDFGSTPLEDYSALLLRLTEVQRDSTEAESRHRDAEDRFWGAVVDRLYSLLWQGGSGDNLPAEERLVALVNAIEQLLTEQTIEIIDLTGLRLADLRPSDVEVLCTRATCDRSVDGLIAETWRPVVRRQGRTIYTGQVIVFQHGTSPSVEEYA